uniref:PEP-CTERM sorting domain-containing protein n=1 Tax=Solibacter usitatus (strain Ellin6076) TaxID=234267 RepID=Q028D6_SOLUE
MRVVAALLTLTGLSSLLLAQQSSYTFTKLATLGDKAILVAPPAGPAFHINDFEPDGLNNAGDVVYGTDLGTSGKPSEWASTFFGEGVFLQQHGAAIPIDLGHSTGKASGVGTFDVLLQGGASLNDGGDAAYRLRCSPSARP